MASLDKIWINPRTKPHKHGSGSFKDAFFAESVKSPIGFDFKKVADQLTQISDPTQIAPSCIILNLRFDPVTLYSLPNQTNKFMLETAAELEIQGKFAADGHALQILGIIATSKGANVIEEYGIDNIVKAIREKSHPLGSIDGCCILILKCGVDKNGVVKKLFDSPQRQKQLIVDSVIDFIEYSIGKQGILLYDIKPPNLCRSPDKDKVVGLDFDPKFCVNVGAYSNKPGPASVMKAYMFLMFACFQWQFGSKDSELIVALHNGFVRLNVDSLLDRIVANPRCVHMLIHYLYFDKDYKPIDAVQGFSPIEVRDLLRKHYIDKIATEAGIAAKDSELDDDQDDSLPPAKKSKKTFFSDLMDAGSRKKKNKRIHKNKPKHTKSKRSNHLRKSTHKNTRRHQ